MSTKASAASAAAPAAESGARWWQLLYSPAAWRRWIAAKSEAMTREHAERNYSHVAPHIDAGVRLLDVGAWDGRLGALLAERRRCQVTLVDVVDENTSALPLRLYDGDTLPCAKDEHFDVVMLLYVLHHARDDERLLGEARRVLEGGGRLLVAEDQVETRWQRFITIAFHLWLTLVTRMRERPVDRTGSPS